MRYAKLEAFLHLCPEVELLSAKEVSNLSSEKVLLEELDEEVRQEIFD